MPISKRVIIDVKTKTRKVINFDHPAHPTPPNPKGIDLNKLKLILKSKGIIASESDIE
jgi:hypothetical protein